MAAFLASVTPANAAVTFFKDMSTFSGLMNGAVFVEDRFNHAYPAADTLNLDSGIVSTNSGGNRGPMDNSTFAGMYMNALDTDGGSASSLITWVFPNTFNALCFDYFGVGEGTVQLNVNGESRSIRLAGEGESGFFGFVSSDPITSITFSSASGTPDDFAFDNVEFGDIAAVPLPAALPMFALGLAGLGALRRRKRAAA